MWSLINKMKKVIFTTVHNQYLFFIHKAARVLEEPPLGAPTFFNRKGLICTLNSNDDPQLQDTVRTVRTVPYHTYYNITVS